MSFILLMILSCLSVATLDATLMEKCEVFCDKGVKKWEKERPQEGDSSWRKGKSKEEIAATEARLAKQEKEELEEGKKFYLEQCMIKCKKRFLIEEEEK